ncbi:very short patch repair endonuclease [Salibacterium lacus]|uniref:Very short patch repair endonuclease n=1 Tax=Salibacterium lacus TaxID=1898109 RepID=A0ABW5T485_9BACI
MSDIMSDELRSKVMSRIKNSNTKPELIIRKGLHALGFRYRINVKNMAGKPDLVLPKYKAVIFVNGCFWHGHGCSLFQWPKTKIEFWENKITSNINRDLNNTRYLNSVGWKVGTIWECSLRGKYRKDTDVVINSISKWVKQSDDNLEIKEHDH